ncbi:unnamed protein product [Rhizoctonia solani]|nr:unnamed protein product [Rhizoctonia solani]
MLQARAEDTESEDNCQCEFRLLSNESGRPVMQFPPQQPGLPVANLLNAPPVRSISPVAYEPDQPRARPGCPIGTCGGEYGPISWQCELPTHRLSLPSVA